MRILICDDEPAIVRQISEIIADAYPDIELIGVHSSAELSEKLAPEDANRNFDLAFLDIAVRDESGVDIAEFVGALCPGVKIVFVSGNQDLVSKAFVAVDDCGYIYKPVDPKLLLGYIERERAGAHKRQNREYFEYTRRGSSRKIGSDSILFIVSERNYLEIHTVDGDSVTVPGKLDEAEQQLKSGFVRCHKSYRQPQVYCKVYGNAVCYDERRDNSDKPLQEKRGGRQICAFQGSFGQMTFFDIFWYVFNFLSIALVVVFLCMNLTPRFNRYAVFFLTLIPFSAIALAQHYFYDVPSVFFKIPAFAYYFISAIAYFKDKLRTRIFVSIVLMSFTYLVSALLITGCIACGLNPYDDIMTYIVSLPNTVGLIVLFGGFTYIRMKKHKNMILPSGQMATFIFFPLSQVIVMAAAMMIISYYGWFRDKNTGLPFLEDPTRAPMIMLCVAAVLCIISDAVLLYIMVRSSQNEKLREELRIKDYQNALNLEYYKNVENSSNEVRKIRHDLANIIQTAYEVVHDGNEVDRESAERMLDQLRTEVSDVKIEKFCPNTLVNAIASNKANECRKNDVAYDFDLNVPKFINMEEVDICKAFVNIFDNAINAAKALEDNRYIKIKSFINESDEMLYISSENAVAPDYEEKKKKRTGNHGYGLKILEETAEKYGGHAAASENGGIFTCVFAAKA